MKKALTLARILVTTTLLGLLLWRVDLQHVAELFAQIAPLPLVAAVLVLASVNPLLALRWRAILADGGHHLRYAVLLRLLFIGWFFNQLLPTGIGGDAVRVWMCRKLGMDLGASIRGVLIDRAWGYVLVVFLSLGGLPVLLRVIQDPLQRRSLIALLLIAFAGMIAGLVLQRLPAALMHFRPVASIATLSRQACDLLRKPRDAFFVIALSAVGLALTILAVKLVGDSLGVYLPLLTWVIVLPPVMLIQLVPMSVGGWGVREAALVVLLGHFGVAEEPALAVSLLVGISQIVVGLPGGLMWLAASNTDTPTKAVDLAGDKNASLSMASGKKTG